VPKKKKKKNPGQIGPVFFQRVGVELIFWAKDCLCGFNSGDLIRLLRTFFIADPRRPGAGESGRAFFKDGSARREGGFSFGLRTKRIGRPTLLPEGFYYTPNRAGISAGVLPPPNETGLAPMGIFPVG